MKKKSKKTRKINLLITVVAVFAISVSLNSCKQGSNKKATEKETAESVQTAEPVETDAWYIDEQVVIELPQVTIDAAKVQPEKEKPASTKKSTEKEIKVNKKTLTANESGAYPLDVLDTVLVEVDYVPSVVKVTKAVVPLDETQTVVAYTKKGKEKEAMQVVSAPDGSVDQVVFYNKKHKDVYNVQVGMTGKEVKKLRKEMKHVVKEGKVFLYNDDSNIMYMMKAENIEGDEIDAAKIDTMHVQAIVWKPTKRELKKEEKEEDS